MMTIDHLSDLLLKHLQGNLSGSGQDELTQWLLQSERNRHLFESVNDEEQLRQLVLQYEQEGAEDNEAIILSKIRRQIGSTPVRKMNMLRRRGMVAAAIALVFAGIGGYFLLKNKKETGPVAKAEKGADIPPGRAGAILTLADGSQVVLDSLGNGVIATEKGTQIVLKNGELAYNDANAGTVIPVYNTLTTPKGRQFQLTLPDGTKAWLNAASSLYYPTIFSGDERRVQIAGEVYFEVKPDKSKPFIVNINGQGPGGSQIEVLGTQFNVNAYANEPAIKTTLIEGKVKFGFQSVPQGGSNQQSAILKPGEQAVLTHDLPAGRQGSRLTIHDNADVDKAVAWKSHLFNFEDASLEEVMRQIERWYDIEVVYEKNIPDIKFGGKMSNDVSLSGLLKSLQESEVHFRLEGRKLIVMP